MRIGRRNAGNDIPNNRMERDSLTLNPHPLVRRDGHAGGNMKGGSKEGSLKRSIQGIAKSIIKQLDLKRSNYE